MGRPTGFRAKPRSPGRASWRAKALAIGVAALFLLGGAYAVVDGILAKPPPAQRLQLAAQPVLGDRAAPVALVAFMSPACEACAIFHVEAIDPLFEDFVTTREVRIYYVHADAGESAWEADAAVAQECMRRQSNDRYWAFTDHLYRNLGNVPGDVRAYAHDRARAYGLNMDAYRACVDGQGVLAAVDADRDAARALGADAPPVLLVLDHRGEARRVPAATLEDARAALRVALR